MGRRERRRQRSRDTTESTTGKPTTSPVADRRKRPPTVKRPPAPWGSLPLTEIAVLVAFVGGIAGIIVRGTAGLVMIAGAVALGLLTGLELIWREHFAGYRSHTTLIAAIFGMTFYTALIFLVPGNDGAVSIAKAGASIAVFGGTFYYLRVSFKRRSGGRGFR